MKIYAPVKEFNGLRSNVRFVNGIGETDDQVAIAWFRKNGYTIEEIVEIEEPKEVESLETSKPTEITDVPNFDELTVEEIREWAKVHGLGILIGNTKNKEKLIDILRGHLNGC